VKKKLCHHAIGEHQRVGNESDHLRGELTLTAYKHTGENGVGSNTKKNECFHLQKSIGRWKKA